MGINSVDPWIAEPDITNQKKNAELTLKDKLLRQIRKVAYTICSYREESERRPGFKSIMDIFEALVCKSQIPYIGLRQGMNPNSPLLSKTAINILRIYLCLDPNTLPISEYRPQSISDKADQIYYSIKPWSGTREFYEAKERAIHHSGPTRDDDYIWTSEFLHELLQLKPGDITYLSGEHYHTSEGFLNYIGDSPYYSGYSLGNYLLSFGRDKQGVFMSIYDIYDFKPNAGYYHRGYYNDRPLTLLDRIEPVLLSAVSKPIYIYDRYYLSEKDIKNELDRRQRR